MIPSGGWYRIGSVCEAYTVELRSSPQIGVGWGASRVSRTYCSHGALTVLEDRSGARESEVLIRTAAVMVQ